MKDDFRPALIGRNAAMFVDYDGTLTPLTSDPTRAYPLPKAIETLQRLSRFCPLAIITGRHVAEIDQFLAPLRLPVAGLRGQEFRHTSNSATLISEQQSEVGNGRPLIHKGDAIARFMRLSPFRGRKPFFFGDEGSTYDHFGMDEYGFQKVAAYGGHGVLVGPVTSDCNSSAQYQVTGAEEMVQLLAKIADRLEQKMAPAVLKRLPAFRSRFQWPGQNVS